MTTENTKKTLEKQFQDLIDKARKLYPNIDDSISISDNMTIRTASLQDYLNLTFQTPSETSSNKTTLNKSEF
ncbi:MAG: hypothetical protein CRN43_02640 [Candidatus Nephrothrix sp. EaCA]|nr:MAG: hypothetical protein CRN43_02640 [Candidatus Nephrothrix sp. EaCA]